jgi:predicted transglutaminase-like cysteine proteinase
MWIKAAVGAAVLAVFLTATGASATEAQEGAERSNPKKAYATEFGRALPPIGFVQFCARQPEDCKPTGRKPSRLAMTPERWRLLSQVNSYVNGKIEPVSDQDLYGQPEYWAYPTDAGDCEDFLLLKRRFLENLGFAPEALLITVVLDEKKEGHAVLTVVTDEGDFVLDNRRDEIRRWSDLEYTFLKRQSQRDPRLWVALTKDAKPTASGFVAGGNN